MEKHAELQYWTEWEKLVQFELHLAGHAERVYAVLPSHVKESYVKNTGSTGEAESCSEKPWCQLN